MTLNLIIKYERSGDKNKIRVDPRNKIEDSLEGVLSYLNVDKGYNLYHKNKEIDIDKRWEDISVQNEDIIYIKSDSKDDKLPNRLWKKRIKNELKLLNKKWKCKSNFDDESVSIIVELNKAGPVYKEGEVVLEKSQKCDIILNRKYPYEPPKVEWLSSIFHPNISSTDKQSNISFSYFSKWNFSNNITDLIIKIEELLLKPDLNNVLDNNQSRKALEFYKDKGFPPQ